jgi:hypothetical protein
MPFPKPPLGRKECAALREKEQSESLRHRTSTPQDDSSPLTQHVESDAGRKQERRKEQAEAFGDRKGDEIYEADDR